MRIAVSNIVYLLTSILLTLTSTLTHFIKTAWLSVAKIVFALKCYVKKKVTMDILNTICNRGCLNLLCRLFVGFDSFVLENCIFGVLLKANNNITILKLNSLAI